MQTELTPMVLKSDQVQMILDKIPSLLFMMDPDTLDITFANAQLLDCLQYARTDILEMDVERLNFGHSANYWHHIVAFLLDDEQVTANAEMTFVCRNAVELPVAVVVRAVELDGKKSIFVTALDITARKNNDARLLRLTKFSSALSLLNQAIVRMGQEADLLSLACRLVVDCGDVAMAWVGKLNDATGLVSPVATYGYGLEYLDHIEISVDGSVVSGLGPVGKVFRESRIVIVNDFMADSDMLPWHQRARQVGWEAVGSFPILRAGKVFAVLSLYHSQKNAFDCDIINLVQEMCGDIAFACDNFDREENRQAMEKELKLAALVFQHSSQAMMVTDEHNRVVFVNQAYIDTTGYSLEEVKGKPPKVANSGRHSKAFYKAMWKAINQQHYWQGRIWSQRKNKEIYPEWLTVNVVLDESGMPYRYVATLSDITDKVRSEEMIWKQANFDMLTGLSNRYRMYRQLTDEIKRGQGGKISLSVLYIDLDQFKEVNDTLGHQAGDQLLVEVAARLSAAVVSSATIARLGGDEFAVILFERSQADEVAGIAQGIINKLDEPFRLSEDQRSVYISASIGIAFYPADAKDAGDLLKKAEQAMYVAKNAGRNRLNFYTSGLQEKAQKRLNLLRDLREALVQQQFVLYFQPIVNMVSGDIVKAEALVRWNHPVRGMINPAEFIPLAEETGLIVAIGDWVFKQATNLTKRWVDTGKPDFQVSVNMSPVQFKDEATKIQVWLNYLQELGLSGKNLVIEITEGLLLDVAPAISNKLLAFRDAGIQISMDDFGTGYSALSYLKKFDIDYLKIDQSFVRDMTFDASDAALVEAIIVMAHKLGLKVVAEGVETEQQHKLLISYGCDYGQGYLYSHPLGVAEFEKLLGIIRI
ncbi:MAG: sensor domain-containing protein [Sulfuriferula sp.]